MTQNNFFTKCKITLSEKKKDNLDGNEFNIKHNTY